MKAKKFLTSNFFDLFRELNSREVPRMEKIFYTPKELVKLGIPKVRAYEIARKIGRKSDPDAERGFKYLVTLEEVKKEAETWLK
jgi:hypothetical protein